MFVLVYPAGILGWLLPKGSLNQLLKKHLDTELLSTTVSDPGYGVSDPGYGDRSGVRGYQIRSTGIDPGYEDIRSGVRGYQIRSTGIDPGYEGIRSGVRGYQIRSTGIDPGYEGIRSEVRG